ncbi:MAG: hypothetical protein ACXVZX_15735 [Terriglobales bacterium]
MDLLFKESGRSARIATRFFNRIVRVELTHSALSFHTTLLTIKCKELISIPADQIESVKYVLDRGVGSFEVNTKGRSKMCWFDTTMPDDWEAAFAAAGVIVEREPDEVGAVTEHQ